jgi:predicted RNA-binding protein with TRAM domain
VINQDSKEVIEISLDPKPVQICKEYEITEGSRKSDGIALIQGFVEFVKKRNVKIRIFIRKHLCFNRNIGRNTK